MPVELTDAIGRANATSSFPDHLVAQEDATLVAGARTGGARVFDLLVQRHKGKIVYCLSTAWFPPEQTFRAFRETKICCSQ